MKMDGIYKIISKSFYPVLASWIVVAGWNWYHLAKRPHLRFILISLAMWVALVIGYHLFVFAYTYAVRRFHRHPFWQNEFKGFLDKIFLLSSLLFLVFFIKNEFWSLVYVTAVFFLIFWRLQYYLSLHPGPKAWLTINRTVFYSALIIFILQALVQYLSYRWYILDAGVRFYNIVFFRAWTMTSFWLLGFAVGGLLYWKLKSWFRYFALGIWSLFFVSSLFFWSVDLSTLFYSGLHFGPSALLHLKGSGELVKTTATLIPVFGFIAAVILFVFLLKKAVGAHKVVDKRYWYYYHSVIIVVALMSVLGLSSFRTTPERVVIKSFYNYYRGFTEKVELSPALEDKLEKFGLSYNTSTFYVAGKNEVYSSSSPKDFLPAKFKNNKPNIIIVFLESFSTRLTSVYNSKGFKNLTPGLEAMASDKNTTVFHKYFNASTPTVTGLISQLCSFLPPTGHEEIQSERKLKRLMLECLPDVLHSNGYKDSLYMTAISQSFANKGSIFQSMGTKEVWGLEELSKHITGEPLSWGYSDHQMFPVFWDLAQKKQEPFLLMLSTVDTHPPFNSAKDVVQWKNSKSNLLNSFHTTDDAFNIFWQDFKQSPLSRNTIVIAVADHAVFPAAYSKDIVPFIGSEDNQSYRTYYDENSYLMYVPDTVLPKEVDRYSSGIDFMPTLLHVLGINIPNSFEGHSIFDDREKYPNVVGMHELGLYINQQVGIDCNQSLQCERKIDYNIPSEISCENYSVTSTPDLNLCDFLHFYKWKRQMFEEGRFWKK